MKARGILQSVVAALTTVLSSCALPAANLTIPEPSAVKQVVVSWSGEASLDREFVIDDPKVVERFLTYLRAHNNGWEKPSHTFPSSGYNICLMRDKELLLVVWLGPNWIGGRDGNGDYSQNRLKSLSDRERTEALEILGIPIK